MSKSKQDSRVELLTELHRPLEEHWAAAPRLGLDAKGSDYVYKFHVARLQDIYSGQELGLKGQIQSSAAKEFANESPATQLYGVRGLLTEMTPERERKLKQKELSWDGGVTLNPNILNHKQQSSASNVDINDKNNISILRNESPGGRRSSSSSPFNSSRGGRGGDAFSNGNKDGRGSTDDFSALRKEVRCLYEGDKLKSSELKVLGMYRFSEDQKLIYDAFVEMISQFDDFDRDNILEDAHLDAEDMSSLSGFTGVGSLKSKKDGK